MTQQFGKHAFDQANMLFKDALAPGKVQALAEQGVAASKSLCETAAAAAHERGKALTEIADMAWDSTKSLNEKVARNWAANIQTVYTAAQLMARAKSLPEIARLQIDFFQTLSSQTTEQTKELVALSTRASQHLVEKVQAAAKKPLEPAA
jgi:hypothetical protein